MIGIDLQTNSNMFLRIYAHIGGNASKGFCQYYGGSAMQDACRLVCSFVNRHGCLYEIAAYFGKLNVQQGSNMVFWTVI